MRPFIPMTIKREKNSLALRFLFLTYIIYENALRVKGFLCIVTAFKKSLQNGEE